MGIPNNIQSFTLFIRPDEKSQLIADNIRKLNLTSSHPLTECDDGDLIIAVGGDGSFIKAVTDTNFSPQKIYTGIHTGTLGFLQNLSEQDIYTLVQYIHHEENLNVQKIYLATIRISFNDGRISEYFALNELLVAGENYSKIYFEEYIQGGLLQKVSASGIIIATSTGDTALSLNTKGAIDFSNNRQLACTLMSPIKNATSENFIDNSIICLEIRLVVKPSKNIQIIIDGIKKNIDTERIKDITVRINTPIQKLAIQDFPKVRVVREKILGY